MRHRAASAAQLSSTASRSWSARAPIAAGLDPARGAARRDAQGGPGLRAVARLLLVFFRPDPRTDLEHPDLAVFVDEPHGVVARLRRRRDRSRPARRAIRLEPVPAPGSRSGHRASRSRSAAAPRLRRAGSASRSWRRRRACTLNSPAFAAAGTLAAGWVAVAVASVPVVAGRGRVTIALHRRERRRQGGDAEQHEQQDQQTSGGHRGRSSGRFGLTWAWARLR